MKRTHSLVTVMGLAFATSLALAVAVLALIGTDTNGIRVALRLTARWSFLLFWTAYVAGAMPRLFGPALAPMARRGREFGLAFAAAHLVHVELVIWLYRISTQPPLPEALFVFFTIGIIWTYLLAALSFGWGSTALGARGWHWLRVLGLNYILLAFARDFVPPVLHSAIMHQGFWRVVAYVPFAAMSVAAPILCLVAAAQRQWGMRQAAA